MGATRSEAVPPHFWLRRLPICRSAALATLSLGHRCIFTLPRVYALWGCPRRPLSTAVSPAEHSPPPPRLNSLLNKAFHRASSPAPSPASGPCFPHLMATPKGPATHAKLFPTSAPASPPGPEWHLLPWETPNSGFFSGWFLCPGCTPVPPAPVSNSSSPAPGQARSTPWKTGSSTATPPPCSQTPFPNPREGVITG